MKKFKTLRRQLSIRIHLLLASGLLFGPPLHAAPPVFPKANFVPANDPSDEAAAPASSAKSISGDMMPKLIAGNPDPVLESPQPLTLNANPANAASTDGGNFASNASQDAEPDNIWERVRLGLGMQPMDSPLVEAHERWYADHPAYVKRMLERSRRYLYHIVEEVHQRGMPMEIALLPMVESGFNPQALSPADAAGIWQFIPATARKYGLEQNSWYDGRRDITAATQAALDYLQKLFMDFGSWKLALAAYNCGEGCVSRAIQRNAARGLPTNYEALRLPNETRNYVPKLMAIRELVEEPQSFGVELNDIPNQPYFTQVSFNPNNIDMRSAARLAGMSVDEFLNLNPAFPRRVIRSDSEVSVLVPIDKADQFQTNLEKNKGEWDSWQPYRAKRGESVSKLAEQFDTTITRLSEHNHLKLYRGRFRNNQVILVPVNAGAETENDRQIASWSEVEKQDFDYDASKVSYRSHRYKVRRGESLYSIARKYRVSTDAIKRWNGLKNGHIRTGQMLVIKQASSVKTELARARKASSRHAAKNSRKHIAKSRYYRVKHGDTLSGISDRFNVDVSDLKRWNGIRGQHIQAGDRLEIRS